MDKKKAAAGFTGLVLVSTAGAYWMLSREIPAYEVLRVIDGDTFETREKQLIRLAEVDAPELEYCGGPEAKKELEKMIVNKPVYLKVTYRDRYMRLLSYVYTPEGFVNEKMVLTGAAAYRLSGKSSRVTEILAKASEKARNNKSGVYDEKCTQEINPKNSKCSIKGNVRDGGKIYSFPGCESYASTIVQLHRGDKWFCSEAEAKKAGFVKAGGCQ